MIPPTRIYPRRRPGHLALGVGFAAALVLVVVFVAKLGTARHARPDASPDPSGSAISESDDPTEPAPSSKLPRSLAGVWIARTSGRALRAVVLVDRVELRVVDASRWEHAYAEGETRVILWPTKAYGRFEVEDRYRPWAPVGGYDDAGLSSCLVRAREADGRKLVAAAVDHDTLDVEFALVRMGLFQAVGGEITGCEPARVIGITKGRFERRLATPR